MTVSYTHLDVYKRQDQKPAVPGHNEIDKFLPEEIITLFRHCTFKITPTEPTIGLYELITEHHGNSDSHLVQLLRQCDRLDSADDKGIVRRKQLANDTVISSPFGFPKEKIDLDCLDCRFRDLQKNLIRDLREYKCIRECANGDSDKLLEELRDKVIEDIRLPYSHALGETRIPANDVTLWDLSLIHIFMSKDDSVTLKFIPLREIEDQEWLLLKETIKLIDRYGALGGRTAQGNGIIKVANDLEDLVSPSAFDDLEFPRCV